MIVAEYDRRIESENKRLHDLAKVQKDADEKIKLECIARVVKLKAQNEQEAFAKKQQAIDPVRFINQKEILQQRMSQMCLDPEQCIYLPKDFECVKQEYGLCQNVCNQAQNVDPPVYADGSFRLESDIWSVRQQAIKSTVDQGFAQSSFSIDLSPQTQGYLISRGLQPQAYNSFFGTAFQQELHSELCRSFDLLASAELNYRHKSSFLDHVVQCNDASFWANSFEAPSLAMSLIDLSASCFQLGCWAIENGPIYLQAMGEGVVESAWDFVHMASHPVETVTHIGQAAYFVMETLSFYNLELRQEYPEIFEPLWQQRKEQISVIADVAMKRLSESTGPERAKAATKLVADCIFQHKAMQALGAVAGVLRANAGAIRTAEFVADIMSSEPELALAGEAIAQATADIETVLQKSLQNELAPIGNSLEKAGIVAAEEASLAVRSISEILAEAKHLGGNIPLSNVKLCDEIKTVVKKLVQEANIAIDAKFRQQFGSRWTMENGIKKRVNMYLDHAFNYEVKFEANKATGLLEVKLSGGHLAGSTEKLAEKGLIKILDKRPLPTGCWEYDCIDVFTGQKITKTEFLYSWNQDMIAKQAWDLFENVSIEKYLTKDNKVAKNIKLGQQELSIVIKSHEKDINVVTIVPYEIPKAPL